MQVRSRIKTVIKKTLLNQIPKFLDVKKLVSVLVTPTLITRIKEKTLKYILRIYYLVQFKKNMAKV